MDCSDSDPEAAFYRAMARMRREQLVELVARGNQLADMVLAIAPDNLKDLARHQALRLLAAAMQCEEGAGLKPASTEE